MAIATRHVCTAGVALLGVGAFAFTPVALPLQALTLRTVAVPTADVAQMPTWIAEAIAGLDDRIAIIGALSRPGNAPSLSGVGAVVRDSGAPVLPNAPPARVPDSGAGTSTGDIPRQAGFMVPMGMSDALARAVGDPIESAAILETAAIDVRESIAAAVTSVVGFVADTASDALGDLRVPQAVANDVLPLIAAIVNLPVAVVAQLMSSAARVIDSLATLDPAAVVDAMTQGVVDLRSVADDAVAGVVEAWEAVRVDMTTSGDRETKTQASPTLSPAADAIDKETARAVNTDDAATASPESSPKTPKTRTPKPADDAAHRSVESAHALRTVHSPRLAARPGRDPG